MSHDWRRWLQFTWTRLQVVESITSQRLALRSIFIGCTFSHKPFPHLDRVDERDRYIDAARRVRFRSLSLCLSSRRLSSFCKPCVYSCISSCTWIGWSSSISICNFDNIFCPPSFVQSFSRYCLDLPAVVAFSLSTSYLQDSIPHIHLRKSSSCLPAPPDLSSPSPSRLPQAMLSNRLCQSHLRPSAQRCETQEQTSGVCPPSSNPLSLISKHPTPRAS